MCDPRDEFDRVLPDEDEVDDGEGDEAVCEQASHHRQEVVGQLLEGLLWVLHLDHLVCHQEHDANRREPAKEDTSK